MVNYGEMLALVEEVYLKVCLGFGSFKVKNLNYTWSDFVFLFFFWFILSTVVEVFLILILVQH